MLTLVQIQRALTSLDDITLVSLHERYSTAGAYELSGGIVGFPYQRMPFSLQPAVGAARYGSQVLSFNVPAGQQVTWIGFWTESGQFRGMIPNGGAQALGENPLRPFVHMAEDLGTGRLISNMRHNLLVGQSLVFFPGSPGTELLPGNLASSVNSPLVVVALGADERSFYVSDPTTTNDGDTYIPGSIGWGWYQRIVTQSFSVQGVFLLNQVVFTGAGHST